MSVDCWIRCVLDANCFITRQVGFVIFLGFFFSLTKFVDMAFFQVLPQVSRISNVGIITFTQLTKITLLFPLVTFHHLSITAGEAKKIHTMLVEFSNSNNSTKSSSINPLRTVVVYMRHGKMEFDTCEQITISSSSLT